MWPFSKLEVPAAPARLEPVLQVENSTTVVSSSDPAVLDLFNVMAGSAGQPVNEQTAMRVSAVYGCVRVIVAALQILPLHLYERDGTQKRLANENPLRRILNLRPHPRFSSSSWRAFLGRAHLLRGDGIAEIIRNRSNQPVAFLPHHPDNTVIERDGERLNYFFMDNGRARGVQQEDVIHVPGLGFDGVRSQSVISHYARQAIGGALAADKHAADTFESGTLQRFAITREKGMAPEDLNSFRNQWVETYGGVGNKKKPLILTGGAEIKELSMSAEDAQLLETRGFNVADICRFFGVPPHMVGHTEKTTSFGSGVEQMSIAFVVYCLQPLLKAMQDELNYKLFPDDRFFFEFETNGLMRGDSKARADFYRAALGGSSGPGWLTPNEVRQLENDEPLQGGDTLVQWSQVGGAAGSQSSTTGESNVGN